MKISVFILLTFCLVFTAISNAQEKPVQPVAVTTSFKKKEAPKSFVIGAEVRSYRYSENRVTHSGLLYGLFGEWYWSSLLGNGKLYGSLLYGSINYDGYSCNVDGTNCRSLSAPTTDLIGRIASRFEWALNKNFELAAGAGYRYLYDRGEGGSFYTRTGQWIYLPIGFVVHADKFIIDVEYDLYLAGNMKSNISEAVSTLPDIDSKQTNGSGYILTLGYRLNESLNVYGFYEGWNLGDSDQVVVGSNTFTEPKSETQSFGVKLGLLF
ncbi:hypothetical protein K2P97_10640 [bacterium]|nr:hypothetical protein [bacterium]